MPIDTLSLIILANINAIVVLLLLVCLPAFFFAVVQLFVSKERTHTILF